MGKRRIVLAVVIVLLIAVTVGLVAVWPARVAAADDLQPGDTTQVIDGNWELTREWDIVREDSGDESLYVRAADESNAWNTFFRLYEDWTVSAQMQPEQFYNGSSLRLVFGDTNENIGLAVSVNYESLTRVRLSVDGLTNKGWKNYLESDSAIDIEDAPVEVKAVRKSGSHKLTVTLSQNGQTLLEANTKTLADEVLRMLSCPGVGVYHAQAVFTGFSVVAARNQSSDAEFTEPELEPGESVPTDEWVLSEGALHNLIDGESAIYIDSEKEASAWNTANTLGDEWTLSFYLEYGRTYKGDTVCGRFVFGPEAKTDGEKAALFTVNYTNHSVNLGLQDREDGEWLTIGSSAGWKAIGGRSVTVKLVKYAGINRVAVFLYDGEKPVYVTISDEMPASVMQKFRHYGVMVYASQVRFSRFAYSPTADEAMPDLTDKNVPVISELKRGTSQSTNAWLLGKHSEYYRMDGKDALYIDSKGQEFCYYKAASIQGAWSVSTQVDFGKYYSDTAAVRVATTNTDKDFSTMLTVRYSPASTKLYFSLQSYVKETDTWTDLAKTDWRPGASSFLLKVDCDGKGSYTVQLCSLDGKKVYSERTVTVEKEILDRMQVVALGTLSSEAMHSNITLNLTGPAVKLSGSSASEKIMHPIDWGTAASSDTWSGGEGITVNTEGAVIVSSGSSLYSRNLKTALTDGFTISTDVLYGSLDSKGLCTARIALMNDHNATIGLFTVKFSKNFDVLVSAQYNENGKWVTCLSEKKWRKVPDNRLHITVSREQGSNTYAISLIDSNGDGIYYNICTMPSSVRSKMVTYAVGVDNATVKFSNIRAKLTGEVIKPTIEDYGLLPIVRGKTAETGDWKLDSGAEYEDGGAIYIASETDASAYYEKLRLTDGFKISTDVHFGSLDSKGVCTARVILTDREQRKLALFTVKFSENFSVLVQGQYKNGDDWVSGLPTTQWAKAQDNRVHVTLERADGSSDVVLTVRDFGGNLLHQERCTIPAGVWQSIAGFALGVDQSTVQFSGITATATEPEKPDGLIPLEPGEAGQSDGWRLESGAVYETDGSVYLSSDAQSYAYEIATKLGGSFTVSTDVHFGALDSKGVSTVRLVLTDTDGGKLALFTLKFSENFSINAQGQSKNGDGWTTLLETTPWLKVQDNRLHLALECKDGAGTLTARDYSGRVILQQSFTLAQELAQKVTGFGLGVDKTAARFSAIHVTTTGSEPQTMVPITVTGSEISSSEWSSASGVAFYSDGSVILTAPDSDPAIWRIDTELKSGFALSTDLCFGTLDEKGVSTARLLLGDKSRNKLVLVTLKFSENFKVMATVQYRQNGTWTTLISDTGWKNSTNNCVTVKLARAAGSNALTLTVTGSAGETVLTANAEAPAEILDQAACFGLGAYHTTAKFSGIACKTEDGAAAGEESVEAGTPAETDVWTTGSGIAYDTDGALTISGSGDTYSYNTVRFENGAFTIKTDVLFGMRAASNNVGTARIALVDENRKYVGLVTLKYDDKQKIHAKVETKNASGWTTVLTCDWQKLGTNHAVVTVSRTESSWTLELCKTDGTRVSGGTTTALPADILSSVKGFGLGSYASKVKFTNITWTAE